MKGEFIFIMILFSLILCSIFVKMYYSQDSQEEFTGSTGSTGSTVTTKSDYLAQLELDEEARDSEKLLEQQQQALLVKKMWDKQDADYNHYYNKQTNGHTGTMNDSSSSDVDMDNYILKSSFVPPMCPACPNLTCPNSSAFSDADEVASKTSDKDTKKEPKPVECGTSTSASAYNGPDAWPKAPCPILPDFTTYGI